MPFLRTWVVIPTYNERENLPALLQRVFASGPWYVLIVDDNSPDGTGQLAEELRSTYPKLFVLHRPQKQGLGPAYRDGFQEVLQRGAEIVVQCDADLSHPPELIPDLVSTIQKCDVAVASRYIHGGDARDTLHRKCISVVGNAYIRVMLGHEIHDWSSGFKAWRASMLTSVLSRPLETTGYAFQMEMLWHARRLGAQVVEKPLIFVQRVHGNSKFTARIIWENIHMAWYLRNYREA